MAKITNYQCPACGGPLQFGADTGKVGCEYCGSAYTVEEIEALYAEKDAQAAAEQAAADADREPEETEAAQEASGDGAWNTSNLTDDWGSDTPGMRAYSCPSCGAELLCEETTAATSCPYCGNTTVVPGQLGGMLKPDFVIPFKLKREDAVAALKKHYKGRPFLPSAFKDDNHLQEVKGVYVPFWLFDGTADCSAMYHCDRDHIYDEGDYTVTRTDHFHVTRGGNIAFEKIPVDASRKMPDDYMDSIEPFDYSELKPFSTAYLPGFLADKYDVTVEESSARADERAETATKMCIRGSVLGYTRMTEISCDVQLHRGEVKYAMLPVWLLTTKWKGENYLFAMNGQTGKFVGNLPVDKGKKRLTFAVVYAAALAVTAGVMLTAGGLLSLLGM